MGAVTSTAEGLDGRPFALAYLRCRLQGSQVRRAAPLLAVILPPSPPLCTFSGEHTGCAPLSAQCLGAFVQGGYALHGRMPAAQHDD